ncbi:hypothetical protein PLESTF_000396900 [Pleodorina starrii]|nr:hypothetical protein PLESTF_000396900 [Pleodorina starrii]
MVNKSRWKSAHDKFPAHVEEAKNSDGNVHRGYSLLEFRVAAELLRVGPVHSADDYWAPSDWQLLLVVSEYMSALLEFLDWFWPDLGWEHHKQAIVLSKRLLQPRSPHTYPELAIDPQLRAAWQSFTFCFWHGTRHLPATPPPGEPATAYSAARDWLTKLVGERGFEAEGHIVSSLQSWIQSTRPRLQEAFPAVDWSRWPTVVWPDPECAYRGVEKRGVIKRRQQEEDYAVRWPLRVTQGRPKFNHLKLEARDGFVVGIPPVKNPPALGFLAISDVMCAFKQAAQHWPSTQPTSPSYLAQQDVVQSFVQNVLRETRGPLAPGIAHEKYRYLGFVACSVLGWNSALAHLALPVLETSTWGQQPLVLPGGAVAMMHVQQLLQQQQQNQTHHQQHHPQLQQHPQQQQHQPFAAAAGDAQRGLGLGGMGGLAALQPLDPGIRVDLGIAEQLAMQPELLMGPDTEALLAMHLAPPPLAPPLLLHPQPQQPLAAGASTAARAAACMAGAAAQQQQHGFGSVPLPPPSAAASAAAAAGVTSRLAGQYSAPPEAKAATRPRPSPFSRASGGANTSAGATPRAASPAEVPQQQQQQHHQQQQPLPLLLQGDLPLQDDLEQQPQQQQGQGGGEGAGGARGAELPLGSAPMSLGGLSSMQDLIDGLPSQADLTWSAILGTFAGEDAGGAGPGGAGPSGTASELIASLPSLLLPSWAGLRPPPLAQQHPQLQPQKAPQQKQHLQMQAPRLQEQTSGAPPPPGPVQPFDSGLPYGGLPQPPLPPPQRRLSPDAPVHVHAPCRASSPCQATITTGSLPSLALTSLAGLPSGGLSRPELSGTEPSFARRSHGEVFTLSPVASCERPNGETIPCSPAPAAAAAMAAAAAATAAEAAAAMALPSLEFSTAGLAGPGQGVGAAAGGALEGLREGSGQDREAPPPALPTGGRRTRRDVAAAAAAAAADQGLPPAPGSIVEPSAKRPHAQADPQGPGATAERVESLGAFLTDQQAGLAGSPPPPLPQQPRLAAAGPPSAFAAASTPLGGGVVDKAALGRQLRQLLRAWSEAGESSAQAADAAGSDAAAAAEVRRRAAELLEQGAPVDATEEEDSAAGASAPAGYTALHWACRRGDVALAELLIRHGADPDRCGAAGTSARMVNPGLAAALAEAQQRAAAQPDPRPAGAAAAASAARSGSQALSSVFASSAGTAAAAAVAAAEAAAQQAQLRNRLAELLRSADQVAAQLALQNPQTAAGQVLDAMRDMEFLLRCIVSGAATQQ